MSDTCQNNINPKITVFIDMDGVLCDFVGGYEYLCKRQGIKPVTFSRHSWVPIPEKHQDLMGWKFWSELEPLPHAKFLLGMVEQIFGIENIYFLSHPVDRNGCIDGKKDWIKKHACPQFRDRLICTKHKHLLAKPNTLLIDDLRTNIDNFILHGGNGFLFPSPFNNLHDVTASDYYISLTLIQTKDRIVRAHQLKQEESYV